MKKKTTDEKVNKELLLEDVDRLRKIKLPPGWEVAKLDVVFERRGILGEYATVIFDARNGEFYVNGNKYIVYPEDKKALIEAVNIMNKANSIIKRKYVRDEKKDNT
jgi:hypothetical protein